MLTCAAVRSGGSHRTHKTLTIADNLLNDTDMKSLKFIAGLCGICIAGAAASLAFASCCGNGQEYANRAEKIVAEIHNPASKNVIVISHRGDWRNYPENSIPAIESIIRMGVDVMELDLKMTKDSVLVLCHDKTINRTTNGSGKVSDITYDSLMTFNLKKQHGVKCDTLKMPTLRQALECCKDRIVVNVDQGYEFYDEVLAITEELGVTDQILIKGKKPVKEVAAKMAQHPHNMMYMPIIDIQKASGRALFEEYISGGVTPLAYEVCWSSWTPEVEECMKKVVESGSKLWVNTLWPSLCGGFGNDDDAAFVSGNPASVYDRYITRGVTMIQTDRPEMLLEYLRSRGLHD